MTHGFLWSLLRKDRLRKAIHTVDDCCHGDKSNGVCRRPYFSVGFLLQAAEMEEDCIG